MISFSSNYKSLTQRNSERGAALIYIFIAIAALAALSYAITQSTRGGGNALSGDKARLYASELIEFANAVTNATTQLRLRGVLDTQLCFDDPRWGHTNYDHAGCTTNGNKIFHPEGAGITWTKAPFEAMNGADSPDNLWHITGANAINQVGTDCGTDSCSELILYTNELKYDVCIKINDMLGVGNKNAVPQDETNFDDTAFNGTYSAAETLGTGTNNVLSNKRSGCFREVSSGTYHYYKVLLAR